MQKLADAKGNACAEMKVVCTREEKKKEIDWDLSHSVTLLAPAKFYRAEHREEFPRAQISSCCPINRHAIILWHHPSSSGCDDEEG